jgi:hypothetical protein
VCVVHYSCLRVVWSCYQGSENVQEAMTLWFCVKTNLVSSLVGHMVKHALICRQGVVSMRRCVRQHDISVPAIIILFMRMLPVMIPCSHEVVVADIASPETVAHAGKAGVQRDYSCCHLPHFSSLDENDCMSYGVCEAPLLL